MKENGCPDNKLYWQPANNYYEAEGLINRLFVAVIHRRVNDNVFVKGLLAVFESGGKIYGQTRWKTLMERKPLFCYREASAEQVKRAFGSAQQRLHSKAFFFHPYTSRLAASSAPAYLNTAANALTKQIQFKTKTLDFYPPCNEQAAAVGHRVRFTHKRDAAVLYRYEFEHVEA